MKSQANASSKGRIERSELYSFLMIVLSMNLVTLLLFPSYYWLFAFLALIDCLSTYARIQLFLSLDRVAFGFFLIVLCATVLDFGVLELIIMSVLTIALLDFSFMWRKIRGTSSGWPVAKLRVRSYLFTLVPAAGLSTVTLYLSSAVHPAVAISPILELGLATAGVFVIFVLLVRTFISSSIRKEIE